MATMQHLYVTAHGRWTNAAWLGERAQVGLRVCFAPALEEPAKGSTFTPMENGEVVTDAGTQSGTHGTLTRAWSARIGPTGSLDNMDAANQVDIAEDVWTMLSTWTTVQDADFLWESVKLAPLAASGAYAATSSVYTFTAGLPGTASGSLAALPPEVAVAVSLRAPIIGRRGRGRVYVPGLSSAALNPDGTLNNGYYTALRGGLATCIANINNAPGIDDYAPIVAVMSAGSATAVRPTETRIGNHFDVQRRRQHQVPETYTAVAL